MPYGRCWKRLKNRVATLLGLKPRRACTDLRRKVGRIYFAWAQRQEHANLQQFYQQSRRLRNLSRNAVRLNAKKDVSSSPLPGKNSNDVKRRRLYFNTEMHFGIGRLIGATVTTDGWSVNLCKRRPSHAGRRVEVDLRGGIQEIRQRSSWH
jgi:hypothetical protein